jgi:hypothetical protein
MNRLCTTGTNSECLNISWDPCGLWNVSFKRLCITNGSKLQMLYNTLFISFYMLNSLLQLHVHKQFNTAHGLYEYPIHTAIILWSIPTIYIDDKYTINIFYQTFPETWTFVQVHQINPQKIRSLSPPICMYIPRTSILSGIQFFVQ